MHFLWSFLDKLREFSRQPNANLSYMLWDMIKFSTTSLNQIIFREELFILRGRITDNMGAFNMCCLNEDRGLR